MKRLIAILLFVFISLSLFAQNNTKPTAKRSEAKVGVERVKRTVKGAFIDDVTVAVGEQMEIGENRVIVHFDAPPSDAVLKRLKQAHNLDKHYSIGRNEKTYVLHSKNKRALKMLQELQAEGIKVEPDRVIHQFSDPNDTYFPQLWGLKNIGTFVSELFMIPGIDANVWRAWNAGFTGSSSVVVALMDSGTDYTHPDLASNIFTSSSGFTVTAFGQTWNCPAGSHGMTISTFPGYSTNCDPMDTTGHGTHTAGTIGAIGNNSTGVIGVSPNVTILPIDSIPNGEGYMSDAYVAFDVLLQLKQQGVNIKVSSNSWGEEDPSLAEPSSLTALKDAGVIIVSAAGNGATSGETVGWGCNLDDPANPCNHVYPAEWSDIAVASMSGDGTLAAYSNYGVTKVHLAAPGVWILSTAWNSVGSECVGTVPHQYCYMGGTSMAAPHVAGVAALIAAAYPSLTPKQIRTAILSSVTASPSLQPFTNWPNAAYTVASGGYLNALGSLQAAASNPSESWTQPLFSVTAEMRRPTIENLNGSASPLCSSVTAFNGNVISTTTIDGTSLPNFYDGSGENTGSSLKTLASGPFNVQVATQSTVTYSGFAAPSGTYSSLALVIRQRCGMEQSVNVTPIEDLPCAMEYSLDAGNTWSTIFKTSNLGWTMLGRDRITLPANQDLSKLQVRYCTTAYHWEDSYDNTNFNRTMEGYDIRTEGVLGASVSKRIPIKGAISIKGAALIK